MILLLMTVALALHSQSAWSRGFWRDMDNLKERIVLWAEKSKGRSVQILPTDPYAEVEEKQYYNRVMTSLPSATKTQQGSTYNRQQLSGTLKNFFTQCRSDFGKLVSSTFEKGKNPTIAQKIKAYRAALDFSGFLRVRSPPLQGPALREAQLRQASRDRRQADSDSSRMLDQEPLDEVDKRRLARGAPQNAAPFDREAAIAILKRRYATAAFSLRPPDLDPSPKFTTEQLAESLKYREELKHSGATDQDLPLTPQQVSQILDLREGVCPGPNQIPSEIRHIAQSIKKATSNLIPPKSFEEQELLALDADEKELRPKIEELRALQVQSEDLWKDFKRTGNYDYNNPIDNKIARVKESIDSLMSDRISRMNRLAEKHGADFKIAPEIRIREQELHDLASEKKHVITEAPLYSDTRYDESINDVHHSAKDFNFGHAAIIGKRDTFEDAYLAHREKIGDHEINITGIFDGHGGERVAHAASQSFVPLWKAEAEKIDLSDPNAVQGALKNAFANYNKRIQSTLFETIGEEYRTLTPEKFRDQVVREKVRDLEDELASNKKRLTDTQKAHLESKMLKTVNDAIERRGLEEYRNDFTSEKTTKTMNNSGSTAVITVTVGDHLYVANVGDARAMIVGADGKHQRLTADHKADDPYEGVLNAKRGGQIENGRLGNRLAVARALGDLVHLQDGLDQTPDISVVTNYKEKYKGGALVLGCDGVFDELRSGAVAGYVHSQLNTSATSKEIAAGIVGGAFKAGSTDNISSLVTRL